jgi:hypothetical protein
MGIITFRGMMKSDEQETIHLRTQKGAVGYEIIKFQVFPRNFGTSDYEAVMQVWKNPQTTVTNVVNFEDHDLLAVGSWSGNTNVTTEVSGTNIIFDRELVNQNIFVTLKDTQSGFLNYYMELKQSKLGDNESTMATLQSIRSRYESYTPAGPS